MKKKDISIYDRRRAIIDKYGPIIKRQEVEAMSSKQVATIYWRMSKDTGEIPGQMSLFEE